MDEVKQVVIDPSSLTTQTIWREVAALKELFETRLDSMDKAISVAHEDLVRVPTDVQQEIGHLKELHDEKFHGVQVQFQERDVRVEKTATDTKTAVDAALQAAKELVAQQNISAAQSAAKQEASFSKQIDAQGILIQQMTDAFNEKIGDLKDRFNRGEGIGAGVQANKIEQRAGSHLVLGVLAILIAAAGIIIGILLK